MMKVSDLCVFHLEDQIEYHFHVMAVGRIIILFLIQLSNVPGVLLGLILFS